jgi:hypothetical protein
MPTAAHRFGRRHRSLLRMTLVCILIVGATAIATKILANEAGRSAARSALRATAVQQAQGCARTQVLRGYLTLRAGEVESPTADEAAELFRIVDCDATFRVGYEGPSVYLGSEGAFCFLRLLTHGYWRTHEPFTNPQRLAATCGREFGVPSG